MKYLLIIEADYDDRDYITKVTHITEEQRDNFLNIVLRLCNHQPKGWTDDPPEVLYKDIISEKDQKFIYDLLPYGEYGIHTIISYQLIELVGDYKESYCNIKWNTIDV